MTLQLSVTAAMAMGKSNTAPAAAAAVSLQMVTSAKSAIYTPLKAKTSPLAVHPSKSSMVQKPPASA